MSEPTSREAGGTGASAPFDTEMRVREWAHLDASAPMSVIESGLRAAATPEECYAVARELRLAWHPDEPGVSGALQLLRERISELWPRGAPDREAHLNSLDDRLADELVARTRRDLDLLWDERGVAWTAFADAMASDCMGDDCDLAHPFGTAEGALTIQEIAERAAPWLASATPEQLRWLTGAEFPFQTGVGHVLVAGWGARLTLDHQVALLREEWTLPWLARNPHLDGEGMALIVGQLLLDLERSREHRHRLRDVRGALDALDERGYTPSGGVAALVRLQLSTMPTATAAELGRLRWVAGEMGEQWESYAQYASREVQERLASSVLAASDDERWVALVERLVGLGAPWPGVAVGAIREVPRERLATLPRESWARLMAHPAREVREAAARALRQGRRQGR